MTTVKSGYEKIGNFYYPAKLVYVDCPDLNRPCCFTVDKNMNNTLGTYVKCDFKLECFDNARIVFDVDGIQGCDLK